jgi:hypothetical protein
MYILCFRIHRGMLFYSSIADVSNAAFARTLDALELRSPHSGVAMISTSETVCAPHPHPSLSLLLISVTLVRL